MWNNSGQTLNQLVSFSSLGPTADGRMKPDITAPGSMLISSFNSSTSSNRNGEDYNYVVKQENVNTVNYYYGSMEGTSMATPRSHRCSGYMVASQSEAHTGTSP